MSTQTANVNKPKKVNYSLYLVTDSNLVPKGSDLFTQVEKAISGGNVTIVQLREKDIDTGDFTERARKLHEITKKYNVPLIINDRVDVAVAIDAEGIHVGQDDMGKCQSARQYQCFDFSRLVSKSHSSCWCFHCRLQ